MVYIVLSLPADHSPHFVVDGIPLDLSVPVFFECWVSRYLDGMSSIFCWSFVFAEETDWGLIKTIEGKCWERTNHSMTILLYIREVGKAQKRNHDKMKEGIKSIEAIGPRGY